MSLGYLRRVIYLVVFVLFSLIVIPISISFLLSEGYSIALSLFFVLLFVHFMYGKKSNYIKVKNGKLIVWTLLRKHTFKAEEFDIVRPSLMSPECYEVCFKNGKTYTYGDKLKNGFYTSGSDTVISREQYAINLTTLIRAELEKDKDLLN